MDRAGSAEFSTLRAVDSGNMLASLLTPSVNNYSVSQFALARTHLLNRDRRAAIQVFTPLIEADYKATEAMLRQIDLDREVITRDELLERLVTLSKRLTPDQRELRFEVFSRVSRLDLNESIRMLDDWIRLEPGEAVLYRWKGEALAGVGRLEEALTAFNQGIEVDPSNAALYARMAQVHRLRVDHPAAEAILRRMAKIDSGARIAAMTQLGQMFAALGLNAQALEAMGELDDQSRQRDPRVLLAMGGAYGQLGQYEKSQQALGDVPRFAPQYAPAQILMARNERRSGRIDDARQRLQALMADPRLRQTAANELLMLQLSTDRDDLLMEWADTFLSVDSLAPEMKVRWLTVRTTISVRNAQWETALAALEQLETLSPHEKYTAARVLVLMQTGKFELARRIFRNSSTLQDSPMGRPLAVVLGADAQGQAPGGLMTYLESIYRGDVDAARSAIDSVPPLPTVFKADLRATLDRADIRTPEMAEAARSTIAAVLANTVGMTRLAAEFCRQALDKMPSFTIAQAMLMHALFELGDPIDPVLEIARKTPGSSVAMYVIAVDEGVAGRAPQAAKAFETLAAQEPENHFLAYRKAEYQQKAENFEAAIQTLEGIVKSETAGDHQLMASNDLAYQLAIHKPERMDEAADLARRALERALTNPAIQDTMGWILHLQGNHEDAGKLLNLAIQALRDRPEVHYHLAKVYEALGNPTWMRYHAQAAAAGPRQIKEVGLAADLLSK